MQRLFLFVLSVVVAGILIPGCRISHRAPVVNYDPIAHARNAPGYAGSGFVWKDRYVITSSHSCHADRVDVILSEGLIAGKSTEGMVLSRIKDIALIDLGRNSRLRSLQLADSDPYPGQRLWILDGSRSSRPVIESRAVAADSVRVLEGEEKIRRGSSGSPVVDEKGAVVGMVFASLQIGGLELVSLHPVSEIHRMLGQVFASPPTSPGDSE